MKAHLAVFAISAILIASIGMAPAFGQLANNVSVFVTTDKTSYSEGETILVTGEVRDLYSGTPVTMKVIAPNGNLVTLAQLDIGSDKTFSTKIAAGGALMMKEGTYTITIQYETKNRTATTSFEFGGSTEDTPIVEDVTSTVTDTTASIGKGNALIGYTITGGKLVSIMPENADKPQSLIISIDATENGSITLTIPRSVFDSITAEGEDEEIFVLLDGEEVDYTEEITDMDRTITIEFQAGSEEIEIIGTFAVPEFGTIAAMILAVAIISIIAVSAKSRLSIIPRY